MPKGKKYIFAWILLYMGMFILKNPINKLVSINGFFSLTLTAYDLVLEWLFSLSMGRLAGYYVFSVSTLRKMDKKSLWTSMWNLFKEPLTMLAVIPCGASSEATVFQNEAQC